MVATLRSRNDEERPFNNQQAGPFHTLPVVVLINGQSSGGAELIAATLQDQGRAKVAGQRSLGKASVQKSDIVIPNANAGIKLTTGTFFRSTGKNLHRFPDSKPSDDWGVRPDPKLEFRVSADLGRQLKEWWREQSLRPGASNKALPLDDPENDPARQFALRELLKRIK